MGHTCILRILILLIFFCGKLAAQDTVLANNYKSVLDSIQSTALQQKRYIQVFLPANYKEGSSDKYDVLYVLDGGNWNTGLVAQTQRFVEGQGYMPPTIIVSVMGIDRNKELTPTHLDSWKESGNAPNFLRFITKELIPHINQAYPSNGDNTLWGHSLSGMFAIYAMLNEPRSFTSYIAVDPSLWWDNNYIPKMAVQRLSSLANSGISLFVSGRNETGLHEMRIDTMQQILQTMAPPGFTWKLMSYPDETHSSVRLKTSYDGLKFIYTGHVADMEFVPMGGMVQKDKPFKVWYFDDTTRVHYSIDGNVPTETSPAIQREILVNGPAVFSMKRFTNRSHYDKLLTRSFIADAMPAPLTRQKKWIPGGFSYSYYEGEFYQWPDISKLQPVKTGVTDSLFDPEKLPRKNNYALLINGYLEAKEDGYYLFIFQADKHSKMYVGDKLLMDWDGNYNRMADTYLVPLKKGFYPLRIEFLHKKEDFKLRYSYLTPSIMDTKDPIPFPVNMQYRPK